MCCLKAWGSFPIFGLKARPRSHKSETDRCSPSTASVFGIGRIRLRTKALRMFILDAKVVRCYCSVCGANSDSGICSGATGPSEDSSEFNVCERPFRPRRLNACALCGRAFSPKTGLFNLFSGTSPTVRGLTAPVAVDLRKGFRWNSGLLISDC